MELQTPEKEVEYEPDFDDKGKVILKKKANVKRGKKAKASGAQFELRVRKDLEEKGWIVDKWSNNVDLKENKIIAAKKKFNPFAKLMTIGTGFPDFVVMQKMDKRRYRVIGVEVKINGTLSKEEKLKAKWYMENEIFSEFLVAKKVKEKNRIKIEYIDINKILGKMR